MSITIDLPPDVEAELIAQARAQGLALPQHLEHLLREQVPARCSSRMSAAERAAAWRASANGLPHTPPLSDEAIGRESIYGDRG